ncbi:MAG: hypothetical protein J3Q66DRAFT_108640 [Benniella sp.]|nr:MAG: hypothetical protein J3Q66DRAFT_108640 [Benniella sp.]
MNGLAHLPALPFASFFFFSFLSFFLHTCFFRNSLTLDTPPLHRPPLFHSADPYSTPHTHTPSLSLSLSLSLFHHRQILFPSSHSSCAACLPYPTPSPTQDTPQSSVHLSAVIIQSNKHSSPVIMPLSRPPPAILSSRNDPVPFSPSVQPTVTFTLTAGGLLTQRIKCVSENKKESYSFQSKSDANGRSITVKDGNGNLVCKVKNRGSHLLDLHLTTESKDVNVQFRDMIAFKKAVEKNSIQYKKVASPYSNEQDLSVDSRHWTGHLGSTRFGCASVPYHQPWTCNQGGQAAEQPYRGIGQADYPFGLHCHCA